MRMNCEGLINAGQLLACILLISCASGKIELKSAPEGAEAFIVKADGSQTSIGKTPILISSDRYPETAEEIVNIRIEKEGYQSERVVLPKFYSPAHVQLNVTLKAAELSGAHNLELQVSELTRGVATAQNYLFKKNYSQSTRILTDLISKYPKVSVLYDLAGNSYYLEKNLTKALELYRGSLKIDPSNIETTRMVEKLSPIQQGVKN